MYIIMEYFKKCRELKTIIEALNESKSNEVDKSQPILVEEEVRQIMYMLFKGLSHIHENGIVHRDLKTENCLLNDDLNLRIIDFGLAKVADNREFGKSLIGTMLYMAPEVFESKGNDNSYKAPVDMWSAGIIMFELFSGRYPFPNPDIEYKVVNEEPEFF